MSRASEVSRVVGGRIPMHILTSIIKLIKLS